MICRHWLGAEEEIELGFAVWHIYFDINRLTRADLEIGVVKKSLVRPGIKRITGQTDVISTRCGGIGDAGSIFS